MAGALRLLRTEKTFGLQEASYLLLENVAPWVQELGLLIERIEASPPPGAPADWQSGAVMRLPFSKKLCNDDGAIATQALLSLADTAMMLACATAWDGYRPMSTVDQTMHFMRPVTSDVLADARIIRISRTTTFGRVTVTRAIDGQAVGMVSSACATTA
jgi:acyl-coenzyme A thioesterase PaaI-like protein